MSGSVLSVHDLTVRYPGCSEPALRGVCLSLLAGERVALLGLNGSGKTTLLLALAGLVPFEGRIEIQGQALTPGSAAEVRRSLGLLFNVPEDQLLFPRVLDDVAFGPLRRGCRPAEAHVEALSALRAVGIEGLAEAEVATLSHGQKQRVALAGALATRSRLLLLDEPVSGLDPPARRLLLETLAGLEAGMLVATHDLDFSRRLCSRAVLLEQGRLIADPSAVAVVTGRWFEEG